MDEVDGLAHGLGRVVEQDARRGEVARGVAAALAHDVVDVEKVGVPHDVAVRELDVGGVAGEVGGESHGDLGAAEGVLAHDGAGVLGAVDADGLEVLAAGCGGDDLDDLDGGAALADDAQGRAGGGGAGALLGGGALGCRGAHADGDRGALADDDAGAREGVLVVDGDEDGLLAAGVRGDLDVGRAVGHAADPVDGLVAEASLDLGEDLGQAVEGGAGA